MFFLCSASFVMEGGGEHFCIYSLPAEPFLSDGKNWSFYYAEEIASTTFKRPVMIILVGEY